MPCVQRLLYLNEMTKDFGSKNVEVPKGVDGREPETCWNAVWPRAERQQEPK